ncbi:MAG: penicillin acylase family protein [Calditrichaeota bacterium]|nr:MAG: penicillin acylase family protein [Calditrichota bacterium]
MKAGVKIWRDKNGVPHIEAENKFDMFWGQGYVHAMDRGLQLLLMRILGKGRACELLDASDDTLLIDKFFRKMNWKGGTKEQLAKLDKDARNCLDAYCDGINAGFAKRVPWEFKLLGYSPEKWCGEDSMLISRMIGYLTLVQSQAEMERFFIEMVQAGVPDDKLHELFPGILGGLDIALLKKVKLEERIVPPEKLWNIAIPRMMASNNWVLAGKKTRSGKPVISNDPHLETNRLPNVWCELVLSSEGRYMMGGTMPGVPGILSGRTPDIAWAVTYSFIDAVDSWVEHCKDGKYFREEKDQWLAFTARKEIIKRKKKEPVEAIFYENEHGILDGDPAEESYLLASRWAAADSGGQTLSSFLKIWDTRTVEEGMKAFGEIETGWSFLFADQNGDIGFQMSGLVPKRREGSSGFVPLPGWKAENDWQGFYKVEEMPRSMNPENGFLVTANNNFNELSSARPINMPMGPYRFDRITALLESKTAATVEEMCAMHYDVFSLQAQYFMDILRPLLPDTAQGKILRDWDLKYELNSKGAFLFEEFYKALYREIFGERGFGTDIIDYLQDETGMFNDFYENFDRILLAERSVWFGDRSRDEIYTAVAEKALQTQPKTWGEVQEFTMLNMLFGGKLPKFLGFDRGPVAAIGNRATISQGQLYRSANRQTSFLPSLRIATDLASDEIHSNLAGGPSDRRFSKWYCSDLENWKNGKYKILSADSKQEKNPFK